MLLWARQNLDAAGAQPVVVVQPKTYGGGGGGGWVRPSHEQNLVHIARSQPIPIYRWPKIVESIHEVFASTAYVMQRPIAAQMYLADGIADVFPVRVLVHARDCQLIESFAIPERAIYEPPRTFPPLFVAVKADLLDVPREILPSTLRIVPAVIITPFLEVVADEPCKPSTYRRTPRSPLSRRATRIKVSWRR